MGETSGARLTADDLEAIRDRANAATVGPWEVWDEAEYGEYGGIAYKYLAGVQVAPAARVNTAIFRYDDEYNGEMLENAQFIAHAREDVPSLLDEIAALTTERDQARAEADAAMGEHRWSTRWITEESTAIATECHCGQKFLSQTWDESIEQWRTHVREIAAAKVEAPDAR